MSRGWKELLKAYTGNETTETLCKFTHKEEVGTSTEEAI